MTLTTTLPARAEVPVEETWDLNSVFSTPADWEAAGRELVDRLPALAAYQGRLGESPQVLAAAIDHLQQTAALAGRILVYASNAYAVDTTDQAAAARTGQARSLMSRFQAATAFFDPELMLIGFDRLRQWMSENPELTFFSHYVDTLERRKAHVRSSEVEEVLALAGEITSGPFAIYSALNNADLQFPPAVGSDGQQHEVGQASLQKLLANPDREIRRTAWENYADAYLGMKNTYAAVFATQVKADIFNMRARGYGSSLEASLEPNHIPLEVFHNLIDVFRQNLPTWHRYWRLRKRALGLDRLSVYDLRAPLSTARPEIPFEQAVDWICEGMAPLGEEYVSILRRGCLEERWVDRARNRGKRDGAFSSGTYGTRPFIMMSYAGDVFSLSTLAHELGHSLHSYYSRREQPFIYSRYGLFAAEVASNFNQAMVRDYLFRTQTDRDFQVALIEEAMANYQRYFFIMPTLARFELEVHGRMEQGAPVSAESLVKLMAGLFREGYADGDEDIVDFDEARIGITWAQFLHMYMNFYVYQYATGISGAHALSQGVLQGRAGAVDRYLEFLKSGGSRFPIDALQAAGVDLSLRQPVEDAFGVLKAYVERLESLV